MIGSNIVEFRVYGTVKEAFLKGDSNLFSHSLIMDVNDKDVESVKLYISIVLNYYSQCYCLLIYINAVKFTYKENVSKPFPNV